MEPSSAEFQPNRIENAPDLVFDFAGRKRIHDHDPRKHDINDDVIFHDSKLRIAGLFDGMGGYNGGDVASRLALNTVTTVLSEIRVVTSLDQAKNIVKNALEQANRAIAQGKIENKLARKRDINEPDYSEMGTTASILKLWQSPDNKWFAVIGNAGDSRVYILKNTGALKQITVDDSYLRNRVGKKRESEKDPPEIKDEAEALLIEEKLNTCVDMNSLTEKEKAYFERRNWIDNPIDGNENMKVNINVEEIQNGDIIIITSDGIHDNLTDVEIEAIVRDSTDSQMAVDKLIEAAYRRSCENYIRFENKKPITEYHPRAKKDDMSAIVVNIAEKSTETPRIQQSVPYDAELIPEDQTTPQDEVPDHQQTEAAPLTETPTSSEVSSKETQVQKKISEALEKMLQRIVKSQEQINESPVNLPPVKITGIITTQNARQIDKLRTTGKNVVFEESDEREDNEIEGED